MSQGSGGTVDRVLSAKLCAGCGACAGIAPASYRMQQSGDGFLRPERLSRPADDAEARIAAACPALALELRAEGRRDHRLWGPYLEVRTGHANDSELRRNASSGGVLSALLTHLLESGAVDEVVQVGADPDLPFGNRTALSSVAGDIFDNAGSRYAPSAPLSGVETLLQSGKRLAFVGKPCDVSALRALSRLDPRVDATFPILLSFFCAGVPSLAGARELIERMGVAEDQLVGFRYRGDGWPGFATATRLDGTRAQMSYADSWGGILSRHLQPRCKVCPDGTGGFADVVCADAWKTDAAGYPLFEEEDGESLVLSRTETGARLVREAAESGRISLSDFEIDMLSDMQPGQRRKRQLTLPRILAFRLLLKIAPRFSGFHLTENSRNAGISEAFKNFAGTLRRLLSGRF